MSEESWLDRHLTVVAEGQSAGMSWVIRAGGSPDECTTVLDIELPDGTEVGGGGFGGPALYPGRVMNISVHRADPQIHYVVGRVHPSVVRVHLELAGAQPMELDLHPVGAASSEFGVLFVAAILPAAADLSNVTAWDANGQRLDRHFPRHPS